MSKLTLLTAALFLALDVGAADASLGTPPMPVAHEQHGTHYVTGGVGAWERSQVEAMAGDYGLKLVFAERGNGAYLADVDVTIKDAEGATVIRAKSDGPWFFADVPDGEYIVEARNFGQTLTRRITVHHGRQTTALFSWAVEPRTRFD